MGDLFKPGTAGRRGITDNARVNGRIINPPRYAQLGGLTGPTKALEGNNIKISKPGGGAK